MISVNPFIFSTFMQIFIFSTYFKGTDREIGAGRGHTQGHVPGTGHGAEVGHGRGGGRGIGTEVGGRGHVTGERRKRRKAGRRSWLWNLWPGVYVIFFD